MFYALYANIFRLVEVLKTIPVDMYTKKLSLKFNMQTTERIWGKNIRRIKNAVTRFDSKNMKKKKNAYWFVQKLSYK